ncbi:MAG: hypothetical protein U0W40_11265 [Acidimicrobiia bacterium]
MLDEIASVRDTASASASKVAMVTTSVPGTRQTGACSRRSR